MLDVDTLAQEIRRVDGSNSLGAGALAEALMPFLLPKLKANGHMPYDPETGQVFVNAIGSSVKEAGVNVSCIEMDDKQAARLEYHPVEIRMVSDV